MLPSTIETIKRLGLGAVRPWRGTARPDAGMMRADPARPLGRKEELRAVLPARNTSFASPPSDELGTGQEDKDICYRLGSGNSREKL